MKEQAFKKEEDILNSAGQHQTVPLGSRNETEYRRSSMNYIDSNNLSDQSSEYEIMKPQNQLNPRTQNEEIQNQTYLNRGKKQTKESKSETKSSNLNLGASAINSGTSPKSKLLNRLIHKKGSKLIENVAVGVSLIGINNETILEKFKQSTNEQNNELQRSEYGSTFQVYGKIAPSSNSPIKRSTSADQGKPSSNLSTNTLRQLKPNYQASLRKMNGENPAWKSV